MYGYEMEEVSVRVSEHVRGMKRKRVSIRVSQYVWV